MPDYYLSDRKLTADRLRGYLATCAREFPGVWRLVDNFIASRGKDLQWAYWCFLPLAAAYAIASRGQDIRGLPAQAQHAIVSRVGVIGALYSWRPTQGVYHFDPDLFASVWDTPLTGDIPVEHLYNLPEWCVYIETPGKTFAGKSLHGFFVHLEDDVNHRDHHELRLCLDYGDGFDTLQALALNLDSNTVEGAIESFMAEGAQNMWRRPEIMAAAASTFGVSRKHLLDDAAMTKQLAGAIAEHVRPLISLTLYLCSVSREIADARGGARTPTRPLATRTKKGQRLFPPDRQTEWDVGYRIGAALRRAAQMGAGESTGTTHASPAPHIRRAHWHSYWTGPMDGERKSVLKWLPPIPVGVKDLDDLVPTFRRVGE